MVEADLDQPVRRALRRLPRSVRRPAPSRARRASRRARARRPRAPAIGERGELVVRGGDDDDVGARARAAHRASPHASPPNSAASALAASGTHVEAADELVLRPSASARLRPIRPQPTIATRSGARSCRARSPMRALELEVEEQAPARPPRHRLARVVGPPGVDEQEPAAARADQLAADRRRCGAPACRACRSRSIAMPGRAPALVLPVLVHQLGVAPRGRPARAAASWLSQPISFVAVQVLEHLLVAAPCACPGRRGRATRARASPGVEEQEVARAGARSVVGAELERLDVDRAVGIERVGADAAVRGDVLVLLADRLLEDVDLDLAGRLGERAAA